MKTIQTFVIGVVVNQAKTLKVSLGDSGTGLLLWLAIATVVICMFWKRLDQDKVFLGVVNYFARTHGVRPRVLRIFVCLALSGLFVLVMPFTIMALSVAYLIIGRKLKKERQEKPPAGDDLN